MMIENREHALTVFRQLIARYGLQWTANVPREAWDRLHDCNRFLTENDRRQALGLPTR